MAEGPPKHHIGYTDTLNLVTSLCLTYTICIAGLRVWIRRGNYGSDDLVVLTATVITIGQIASDYAALSQDVGKPWGIMQTSSDMGLLNAATLSGVVCFLVALYLSKCAVLSFLSRITKIKQQVMLYQACNGIVAVLGVASVLMVTVDCPSRSGFYWAFALNAASCSTQSARWQAFTLLDVLTELLLLALPVHLIWGLQMPLKKKATVLTAFYLRLPVLGFSIGRYYFTLRLGTTHEDPGLNSALVLIWLVIQLTYALASSTLSALKAFTESFNSGFGLGFTRNAGEDSYGMSNVSGSSGGTVKKEEKAVHVPMRLSRRKPTPAPDRLLKKSRSTIRVEAVGRDSDEHPAVRLRPERDLQHTAQISADPFGGNGESHWRENSSRASQRTTDDMFIVRETEYSVEHQDQEPILTHPPIHVRM